MKKNYLLLLALLTFFTICFTSCSDDEVYNNHNYVQLDLKGFDLSNGIETAGGKYWDGTFNTEGINVTSQIFKFSHTATDWGYDILSWDGFTVSNSNDNTNHNSDNWISSQWSSVAKGGKDGIGTPFIVAYAAEGMRADKGEFSETDYTSWVKFGEATDKYKAVGVYISNNTWTYYCIKEGSGVARKFEKGDYAALHIYGVKADGTITDPVDFYLADYRAENSSSWTINSEWEWVDLSSLGEVKYIFFKFETTDKTGIYSNTSTYFCLDKLTVDKVN